MTNSMFKTGTLLLVLILLTITGAPAVRAQGPSAKTTPEFVPGEVVVKFKPAIGAMSGQRRLQQEGARIKRVLPRSGLLRVEVAPGYEQAAVEKLVARKDVESVSLNYVIHTMGSPNDTYFSSQWGLTKIQAPQAWDISTGASSVVIAVIDTGVDLDHPDLAAKLWTNPGEIPGNFFDDDGNGYVDDVNGYDFANNDSDPNDDNGHGSHVSGIAAAATNNSTGVAGVSWGAKIMALKALNSAGGGGTADIAEAMMYAVDNGAKIISMSLGGVRTSWPCSYTDIETALNYAQANDVLVVIAAGNDGQYGVNCPGAYDQALAVGATTSSDNRASYSNYGPRLDIVAPGGDISNKIYSTIAPLLTNGYKYYDGKYGTSMATPFVSGLAALVWGMDPSLTAAQVQQQIESSADDLGTTGKDDYFGWGRINAYKALQPYIALTLQNSAGVELTTPVVFMADDATTPGSQTLQVSTTYPDAITWTAAISPPVSWVSVSPPAGGQVTAASVGQFDLNASTPSGYNTYTTTVVVTGTTATGLNLSTSDEVRLSYVPQLQQLQLPVIFKN
ncbi:MAG: hypothetical protein D6768_07540 [Chloroflexi bacterium]|nr:MAG: hypothetical protein D6768_07540 [Chloroflexota bacterium]